MRPLTNSAFALGCCIAAVPVGDIVLSGPEGPAIPLNHQRETGVMANSIISSKALQSEAAAYAWVEAPRVAERPGLPALRGFRPHRQDGPLGYSSSSN